MLPRRNVGAYLCQQSTDRALSSCTEHLSGFATSAAPTATATAMMLYLLLLDINP